jgi:hypothetical protein
MKTNWKINAASIAACGMPLIHFCYVLVFWLLASATLGHWAQPNVNDPKGFLFGIPLVIGIILMLVSFAVAPLAVFLGYKRRKTVTHVVAYVVCLGFSIGLFRLDILQITTWIAD